jgi:16S rRNA (uracil1498-N3)-methyltransferase
MKQSKNLYLPQVITNQNWNDLIQCNAYGDKYIAHCEDPKTHLAKICGPAQDCIVAIGPEGDFTTQEIKLALELGWKEINLGSSRLRTETAGIVVASVLAQINM